MTTKTTQAGIQTVIETGAQIKANHAIVPEWMAKLDDQAPYRVTKMVAPFGTYVLDVQPAELPSSMQIDNPRIDNHTKRALENPETIQGFALACDGDSPGDASRRGCPIPREGRDRQWRRSRPETRSSTSRCSSPRSWHGGSSRAWPD